jgi:hypothetical protein
MPSIIERLFGGKRSSAARVTVTSINLKFMGNSHGLDGMEINAPEFDVSIPFQNKMGSGLLPDNLKGPPLRITKIVVGEPFALLDVSPKLPVEVQYMGRIMFKLRIRAPPVTYEGPLSINFGNDSAENITINIKKVMLHYKEKAVELEESSIGASMQKSQLFKESIQLYKIVSLGDAISSVQVSRPFELVSTDPKLPVRADRKDSYILGMYLKCPDFSYAGDLDITFS